MEKEAVRIIKEMSNSCLKPKNLVYCPYLLIRGNSLYSLNTAFISKYDNPVFGNMENGFYTFEKGKTFDLKNNSCVEKNAFYLKKQENVSEENYNLEQAFLLLDNFLKDQTFSKLEKLRFETFEDFLPYCVCRSQIVFNFKFAEKIKKVCSIPKKWDFYFKNEKTFVGFYCPEKNFLFLLMPIKIK